MPFSETEALRTKQEKAGKNISEEDMIGVDGRRSEQRMSWYQCRERERFLRDPSSGDDIRRPKFVYDILSIYNDEPMYVAPFGLWADSRMCVQYFSFTEGRLYVRAMLQSN